MPRRARYASRERMPAMSPSLRINGGCPETRCRSEPLSSTRRRRSSSDFSSNVEVFGLSLHPITFMMIIGISIQGLAECFLNDQFVRHE